MFTDSLLEEIPEPTTAWCIFIIYKLDKHVLDMWS